MLRANNSLRWWLLLCFFLKSEHTKINTRFQFSPACMIQNSKRSPTLEGLPLTGAPTILKNREEEHEENSFKSLDHSTTTRYTARCGAPQCYFPTKACTSQRNLFGSWTLPTRKIYFWYTSEKIYILFLGPKRMGWGERRGSILAELLLWMWQEICAAQGKKTPINFNPNVCHPQRLHFNDQEKFKFGAQGKPYHSLAEHGEQHAVSRADNTPATSAVLDCRRESQKLPSRAQSLRSYRKKTNKHKTWPHS